jgi:hypothetical protein
MNMKTKTIMNISVLTFLLVAASSRCFAEIVIEDVSTNRAKELGVTIRTNMNGQAGVQVRLEFKTDGKLKNVSYVELQIGDGENRIMSAPLLVSYPSPDRATVRFSAYPAYLPTSTLMIVVRDTPIGGTGYRFKVKDFIEAEFAAGVALGGQADRPAHEWLSLYQAGKTNWFSAVRPIVQSTNGVPELIRELSCAEGKHRELASSLLRQVYSDAQFKDATAPTNSVAWTKWWEQTGRTNSVERLWHNFDSHYK